MEGWGQQPGGRARSEQNVSSSLWARGCLHWVQERYCLPRTVHLKCPPTPAPGSLAHLCRGGPRSREARLGTLSWAIWSQSYVVAHTDPGQGGGHVTFRRG